MAPIKFVFIGIGSATIVMGVATITYFAVKAAKEDKKVCKRPHVN